MFPDLVIRFSEDPVADISERTALVTLSHVHFKSGYRYPMEAVNQAARQKGAWTLWDLSHSVGAVPIDLSTADLAIGCTYKYMNGGPGAPAFLYVHQDLANLLRNPIQGWFGQKNAFEFGMTYEPAAGLDRFAVGTPSVISTALIEPGVDLLLEAGIEWIDERRTLLTQRLIEARLEDFGFTCVTPTSPDQRGSHVTFTHEDAWRINLSLIDAKVIPDFRSPNYLRFGMAPLYNDETDIDLALARLRDIMTSRRYEGYPTARPVVT
jgi:kynureninase